MEKLQFVYVSDVQLVVHAQWLNRGDFAAGWWECSACRRWCEMRGNLYSYCPHCGAKMDERDENGAERDRR